ncbi:SHOCT domain-containing protein [Chryseobacterium camelliae]|uniref:SHOCT domain-containing protein n=2 Tax=Chryseobacterium TaxID=59732 RepID=A0ABU0TMN7_9FLAO|nr:SHOCT domain-containing protein [Chryseobacterium camelliae]MDQ1098294.1 hypothetical protein [Chryseobacterium camelliae]
MRGVRREKDLETRRASAGGVTVNNATPIIAQPQAFPQQQPKLIESEDPFAVLQKLKSLFEHGIISPEEFETKKNEILSRV